MQPLRRTMCYDINSPENSIDFTNYADDICSSPPERVITNPSQNAQLHKCELNSSTMNYRFSNATDPTFILISGDLVCSLAARYFATSLLHYMRWKAESVKLYVAGPSFQTHVLPLYSTSQVLWETYVSETLSSAITYFDSCNVLGFAATPVALVYVDLHSSHNALEQLLQMLPRERSFLIRVVCFSSNSESEPSVPCSNTCGEVQVHLSEEKISVTRQPHSVVNSRVICYLNAMLPRLHHIYICEPHESNISHNTLQCCPPLFFTRHGQSEYNLQDRLGGDPELTLNGFCDARDLGCFFAREVANNNNLFTLCSPHWREEVGFEIWCSQLRRTQHTARPIAHALPHSTMKTFKSLNEIHAGICELMTNEEIESIYPNLSHFRRTDKVGFRYPNGESYRDLLTRLTPLLISLVNVPTCVVVVAHQAVLRTMLSFFGGPSVEEAVHAPCPQRTVWVCTYNRLGEPQLSEIALPTRQVINSCISHFCSSYSLQEHQYRNKTKSSALGQDKSSEKMKKLLQQQEELEEQEQQEQQHEEELEEQWMKDVSQGVIDEDEGECKWTGW